MEPRAAVNDLSGWRVQLDGSHHASTKDAGWARQHHETFLMFGRLAAQLIER